MSSKKRKPNTRIKGFASWRSYGNFWREVTRGWRYLRSPEVQKFLDAVAIDSRARALDMKMGRHFYRAQVAHNERPDYQLGETVPAAALPERMRPLPDRASAGRVNPKGIPCLYLASDKHTAMAEVRPWIGSLVSVGVFRTTRTLRIVDCTKGAELHPLYLEGEPSAEKKSEAVWADIARAFREPATREDNIADYAPTQILAEVFRTEGFDGVAYRSAFGSDHFNIALFDLNAAELRMCSLYEIKDVELKYRETANPYYVQKGTDGASTLVQNVITEIRPIDTD
jgi:hypothetical protein